MGGTRIATRKNCLRHFQTFFELSSKTQIVYKIKKINNGKCEEIKCSNNALFQIVWNPAFHWREFKDARKFVRSLKLNGYEEWKKYYASGKKPEDIPTDPSRLYKHQGWKGWTDFVGKWVSFEEARKWAKKNKIKNFQEWRKFVKENKIPHNIPTNPNVVYRRSISN